MAENSKIEWTDATWNHIVGCSVISPGCTNCYAMRMAGTRLKTHPSRAGLTTPSKAGPVWNGQTRLLEHKLLEPIQWTAPKMIFVCAHGDLFHESIPDEWIDETFAVMALTPRHTFQVLTKRSLRMWAYMRKASGRIADAVMRVTGVGAGYPVTPIPHITPGRAWWPLQNVWLGVSVEDQKRADERIPDLLATPAALHWISAEPLLGPVNLGQWLHDSDCVERGMYPCTCELPHESRINWVVAGGESGPHARPMNPSWVRGLRDQCAAAGTAFLFKQWGEWCPIGSDKPHMTADSIPNDGGLQRMGKKTAGRVLDGLTHDGYPAPGPDIDDCGTQHRVPGKIRGLK